MLDEGDEVGADVNPWPRSPMAQLDVQRDVMKFSKVVGMLPKGLLLLRNKIVAVACYPHRKWVILPMSQGAKEGRLSIRGHTQEKVEIKGFIHAIDKT
jgi:hypothetical protein